MGPITPLVGLAMVAALALVAGGFWLLTQPGANRMKAILMMVAGAVVAFNAWINSLPIPG
jgi:hypothetical protein